MNFVRGEWSESRFAFDGGSIALPASELRGGGKSFVLGFRPESARLCAPDKEDCLRGEVYVTEQMGSETVVFLRCGTHTFAVRAEASVQAEIGETHGFRIQPASVHRFDAATGVNLAHSDTEYAEGAGS